MALLLLGEMAEDEGTPEGDARADAWRWLAGPPAGGWERRAAEILAEGRRRGVIDRRANWQPSPGWRVYEGVSVRTGMAMLVRGPVMPKQVRLNWSEDMGWANEAGRRRKCPPEVRAACLAACRAALAGCHAGEVGR